MLTRSRFSILVFVIAASVVFSIGRSTHATSTSTTTIDTAMPTPRTITQSDNDGTITLRVRERLLIKLGSDWDWTLDPFDATILKDVAGRERLPSGAQALLEAITTGKTKVSLTGDPPCAKSRPPCNLQSRQFNVTIIVR